MTTRTLGIKYEVKGYEKASASLRNLRLGIRKNQQLYQEYSDQQIANSNKVANNEEKNQAKIEAVKQEEGSIAISQHEEKLIVEKTIKLERDNVNFDYYGNILESVALARRQNYQGAASHYLRPRYNSIQGGFYGGIGGEFGRRFANNLINGVRGIFGLKAANDEVDISNESAIKIGVAVSSRIKNIPLDSNSLEILARPLHQKINFKLESGNNFFSKIFDQLTLPLKTIQYSFYEGIGSQFGNQYAKGLSSVLEEDLDFSMERRGMVTGKGVSHFATEGIENVISNVKEVRNEFQSLTESQSLEKFTKFLKSITKTIVGIPTEFNTGTRRGAVDIEGMRQLNKQLGDLDLSEVADFSDKEQVVFTVGGFAAAEGKSGFRMAEEIKKHANEKTEVIGADNSFSDLKFSVFGNKALWGANLLGKVGEMNVKGFNPDAVKLAAQVIALLEKNPNLKATVTGHSAGGFVVEEVQRLLENMGYGDRIQTIATGTPTTKGGLNQENTRHLIGDNDEIVKGAEQAGAYLGATRERKPEDELKGVASHYGEDYLTSESYLKAILGEGFDSEKSNVRRSELARANSQFQGKLIELESLYIKYISQLYQAADDLIEEVDIRPDRLIAKTRRHKLREKGLEKVQEQISSQKLERLKVKDGTETAVLVIGGFSGAKGRSGESFAAKLGQIKQDKKTQFLGVKNEYTDIFSKEEIGNITTEDSIKRILALFADIHKKGYNPDAVNIAAQAIDMQQQRPELNIKIAGYSGGGYVAEDVIELLKEYGTDMSKIEVVGIATPQLPGGIKNRNFHKLLGEQDNIMEANELKKINNQIQDILGFDIFPELMQERQNIEGIESHSLADYVSNSEDVQNFLFGNNKESKDILSAYGDITEKNKEIGQLGQRMQEIQANENLSQNDKLEELLSIRRQYVKYLQELAGLAREAKALGGGRFFTKTYNKARDELAEVKIFIDPLNQKKATKKPENKPQPTENIPDPWNENQSQQMLEEYKRDYSAYLDSLVVEAQEHYEEILEILVPNFAELDPDDQKRYFKAIRQDIEELGKYYRETIAEGDLEKSREIGEELLKRIQAVKQVYAALKEAGETDRSLAGNLARVTSIETEIRTGQPNLNDRDSVGLENYFAQNLDSALVAGEQTNQGFVEGIIEDLERVREAGEEIGRAAQDGLEDELDIQSPSRVFQRLARFTIQGYLQGIEGFDEVRENIRERAESLADGFNEGISTIQNVAQDLLERSGINEFAEELDSRGREVIADREDRNNESSIPEADTIAEFLDVSGESIIQRIGELIFGASQGGNFNQILETIANLTGKLIRIVATFQILKTVFGVLGVGKIAEGFANLTDASLDAAMGAEVLDRRIVRLSGSSQAGARNLRFLSEEAKRLNLDLTTAKENYSQLQKGARFTALEGVQTDLIFTAFSQKANESGLSNPERTRLFEAIRQIMGKRFLSQEEVRQQIGELLGDFEAQLAASMGVSIPTLNKMIESRQVTAEDALPKVAAQIMASSGLGLGEQTAQAALIKVDNSIVQFREKVGFALQPIQKFGYNKVAGFFNWLTNQLNWLDDIIAGGLATLLIYLVTWKTFGQLVKKALLGLIKVVGSFKMAIATFIAQMVLAQLAINTWLNVLKISQNAYPEAEEGIEKMTLALEKLTEAYHNATAANEKFNERNDKATWQLNEGWELPDNWFGKIAKPIVGGDRLNLDNFVRKRLQNAEIWGKTAVRDIAETFGLDGLKNRYNNRLNNLNTQTYAEKKQNDFRVATSDITLKTNQILEKNSEAVKTAEDITKLDAEIAQIQSARLRLLPQDKEGLKQSLEAERGIQKERDKLLRFLTQQQQALQLAIQVNKNQLEQLEQDYLGQEKNQFYFNQKSLLEGNVEAADIELKEINNVLAQLPKTISEFERQLRNANERVSGFMEQRDRILQAERTRIYADPQKGTQVIDLEVAELEREDIEIRIDKLVEEIKPIQDSLNSPELAEGLRRVQETLSLDNLFLLSDTIARLLEEERDSQEKLSVQGIQTLNNFQGQLLQLQEQAAQNLRQSQENVISFNRTIQDYFFNLQQRIKEAQVETERLIEQIFYQDIKSQLRRAIAPGSESFINGIIDGVQSLLDQAQQIFEQKLGLKSSRLQVESELRSNDQEMQDFIRQVRGATDALLDFRNNLNNRRTIDKSKVSENAVSFPLSGLTLDSSTITSGFGWRNIFGRKDFHEGIDIAAKGGSDVLAVRSGVVKHIKPLADQMQVGIESINQAGDRVLEWFIHLGQKLNVTVGDRVFPGQKIGKVAQTSAYARNQQVSTGDHLDYRAKVNGQWVDPKTLLAGAEQGTVKFEISKPGVLGGRSDPGQRAASETNLLSQEKLQGLNLTEIFNSYGLKDLETAVSDQQEKIRRQFQIEELQKTNQFADLLDKLANLQEQSVIPNANLETQRELRQVAAEFRGLKFEGLQEVQKFADELATIQGVMEIFPDAIAKIQSSGSAEALAVLPVLNQILSEAQTALPQVQSRLKETSEIYKAIADEEAKRVAFIEKQGKLKKMIEILSQQEELQQLRSNIVLQRGTNEQRKQNELHAKKLRLEKRIAEIKQQYGHTDQASELIKLEERNSAIAVENINREAYNRDLGYEQELLNLNSGMEDRKAESARSRGFELEANKIQRENAIAQEYFRYDQEISRLEQEYAGDPEKLERLKQAAFELSQINLASIDEQFKDLGGTIEDLALNEFQGFFSSLVSDIQNVGDLALKMIGNIARSIGQIFAKRAASQIFGLIFKSAVGFRDGGTVENYEEGGTVERVVPTNISDRLQQISAPIRNAFRREGSGGRLAVFTPGEEILSIKTGEAGRYQALKKEWGVNPLEKIFTGNFVDGGTIEANLLAGLDYSIPTINVAAIGSPNRTEPAITKNFYLSSSYQVPDMDSFKASEYQIQQEQLEQLRRMNGRQ